MAFCLPKSFLGLFNHLLFNFRMNNYGEDFPANSNGFFFFHEVDLAQDHWNLFFYFIHIWQRHLMATMRVEKFLKKKKLSESETNYAVFVIFTCNKIFIRPVKLHKFCDSFIFVTFEMAKSMTRHMTSFENFMSKYSESSVFITFLFWTTAKLDRVDEICLQSHASLFQPI